MSIQQKIDVALKAVCSIHGVSFGKLRDKATWRIDFKDEATDAQRAAALSELAAFDIQKVEHNEAIDAQIAALEATVTQRRIREAVNGTGKAWLDDVEQRITALRTQRI